MVKPSVCQTECWMFYIQYEYFVLEEERLKEDGRVEKLLTRRAAGCVRAQDASLCFNSVVSLWSSSSLLGNKNILVFPPNERSGGSQMCKRGGEGGGFSFLRLNWGAGRGDLQYQLFSSRRGRLQPLAPDLGAGGGGGAMRSSENVNRQQRLSRVDFFWPCWKKAQQMM